MAFHHRKYKRAGFTLVELLVVIAIIALLMAILVPSLSRARAQAKLSVCMSNLRQIGAAVQTYGTEHNGAIPRGPADPLPYYPDNAWNQWATNQIWVGFMQRYNGSGPILQRDLREPRAMFCPADDTNDPTEELEKLVRHPEEDAYCSYLYRQLDQTTRDRLESLGENDLGFRARALALDANSLGPDDFYRTNHEAQRVNTLYLEGHVLTHENREDVFSIREMDYYGFPGTLEQRLNEILRAADYAERDDPTKTPKYPPDN